MVGKGCMLADYFRKWRLQFSISMTLSAVDHTNNREVTASNVCTTHALTGASPPKSWLRRWHDTIITKSVPTDKSLRPYNSVAQEITCAMLEDRFHECLHFSVLEAEVGYFQIPRVYIMYGTK